MNVNTALRAIIEGHECTINLRNCFIEGFTSSCVRFVKGIDHIIGDFSSYNSWLNPFRAILQAIGRDLANVSIQNRDPCRRLQKQSSGRRTPRPRFRTYQLLWSLMHDNCHAGSMRCLFLWHKMLRSVLRGSGLCLSSSAVLSHDLVGPALVPGVGYCCRHVCLDCTGIVGQRCVRCRAADDGEVCSCVR